MRGAYLASLAALLITGCAAEADEVEDGLQPDLELTGRVVDDAGIMSDPFEVELTRKLEDLEAETQVQLVVASTPDLKGDDIASYAFELVNAWGLGSAERSDGLLLLVAPNERKVRIEVGRGLEASVRDEDAGEIIREAILPAFRNDDFETGIRAGVDGLIAEVTPFELKEAA